MLKSNHITDNETGVLIFAVPHAFRGYYPMHARVTSRPTRRARLGCWSRCMYPNDRAGVVKLTFANPQDMPDIIDFSYFTDDPEDNLNATSDAVTWGRRVYWGPYGAS